MTRSLLILGRQPKLGLAELESLYGGEAVKIIGEQAAAVDIDPCLLDFRRLGGSLKLATELARLDAVSYSRIKQFLLEAAPSQATKTPPGKLQLGISAFGFSFTAQQLTALALSLKKAIQSQGKSVRVIPNDTPTLNSGQVIHNDLTAQNGWELLLIKDGQSTVIARTALEQDIASYTLRDRGRPKRYPKVGMLPPKLAQIIINLGAGKIDITDTTSICDTPGGEPIIIKAQNRQLLDPFCGTGVILQEALLMGFRCYGSDISDEMVVASRTNLQWLGEQEKKLFYEGIKNLTADQGRLSIELADATIYQWKASPDFVASELYLGRAFNSLPAGDVMAENITNCNLIVRKFLLNLYPQLKPGARLCLAVPAWQTKPNNFKFLPVIDHLTDLGYNQIRFKNCRAEDLVYARSEQIVARQLLVLEKI